jgi:hypothetical protein
MQSVLARVIIGITVTISTPLFGQEPRVPLTPPTTMKSEPGVTYGRIKEFTAGQKIVVDVDNALDKSYDLSDKEITVNLAKGLKVGDSVKVTERDVRGKKTVQIVRHSGGQQARGETSRSGDAARPDKPGDTGQRGRTAETGQRDKK